MGQVSTRWSDDHRVNRPATDDNQCVTRHKNLTEVQNFLWDRFRDFFRFLVPNFFQVQFKYHPKIQKSRERDETDTETQTDTNILTWNCEVNTKDIKAWNGQVGKSWHREVSRPRLNISVTSSDTFFCTNLRSKTVTNDTFLVQNWFLNDFSFLLRYIIHM